MEVVEGVNDISTEGAHTDGPDNACAQFNNDVWYTFVAPVATMYSVSLCGVADIDSVLAVYGSCSNGTAVACSDDSCGLAASTQFWASAGVEYKIRVGSYTSGQVIRGPLNITRGEIVPPDPEVFSRSSSPSSCSISVCGHLCVMASAHILHLLHRGGSTCGLPLRLSKGPLNITGGEVSYGPSPNSLPSLYSEPNLQVRASLFFSTRMLASACGSPRRRYPCRIHFVKVSWALLFLYFLAATPRPFMLRHDERGDSCVELQQQSSNPNNAWLSFQSCNANNRRQQFTFSGAARAGLLMVGGLCVEAPATSAPGEGASDPVRLRACTSTRDNDNQLWARDDSKGWFVSVATRQCLDSGASVGATNFSTRTCQDIVAQRFFLLGKGRILPGAGLHLQSFPRTVPACMASAKSPCAVLGEAKKEAFFPFFIHSLILNLSCSFGWQLPTEVRGFFVVLPGGPHMVLCAVPSWPALPCIAADLCSIAGCHGSLHK